MMIIIHDDADQSVNLGDDRQDLGVRRSLTTKPDQSGPLVSATKPIGCEFLRSFLEVCRSGWFVRGPHVVRASARQKRGKSPARLLRRSGRGWPKRRKSNQRKPGRVETIIVDGCEGILETEECHRFVEFRPISCLSSHVKIHSERK